MNITCKTDKYLIIFLVSMFSLPVQSRAHRSGTKQGTTAQGKHREFGNLAKTQGKHREFGLLKL